MSELFAEGTTGKGRVGDTHAMIHGDIDTLVAAIVSDGQTLQAPTVGQYIGDEIHASHLIDGLGSLQPACFDNRTLGLLAAVHRQVGFALQTIDLLVVRHRVLRTQQVVDSPVGETTTNTYQIDYLLRQDHVVFAPNQRITVSIAGQPLKAATVAPSLAG